MPDLVTLDWRLLLLLLYAYLASFFFGGNFFSDVVIQGRSIVVVICLFMTLYLYPVVMMGGFVGYWICD